LALVGLPAFSDSSSWQEATAAFECVTVSILEYPAILMLRVVRMFAVLRMDAVGARGVSKYNGVVHVRILDDTRVTVCQLRHSFNIAPLVHKWCPYYPTSHHTIKI
jgi:hypothetical protein